MFSWFRKKNSVFNATLPGDREAEGELNPLSPTWVFVEQWAKKTLNDSRIANDNLKKNDVDTAALRGRIKTLKEILDLPGQPAKKAALKMPDEDYRNFAGY